MEITPTVVKDNKICKRVTMKINKGQTLTGFLPGFVVLFVTMLNILLFI
jgi:hypothetical protein